MFGIRVSAKRVREVFAALLTLGGLAIAYRDVVPGLVQAWSYDDNYSHGYLIVPIALYLAWERRHRFFETPSRGTAWGLFVIAGSLLMLAVGTLGVELFLTRVSLLGALTGVVLFFHGWPRLMVMAFPLAFLVLMIPLPAIVFNQLSFPLQLLASQFGEMLVQAAGMPVTRDGNVLVLEHITLQVAEACSGIRSLVSLMTLGIIFAYVAETRTWARIVIVASAVPVALACNALRIAGTAVASHYFGAAAAEGVFHEFSGWLLFSVAFGMMVVVHRALLLLAPNASHVPVAPPVASGPVDGHAGASGLLQRAATAFTILTVGAVAIGSSHAHERVPPRTALTAFPAGLGQWRGYADPPLADDVRAVLNADDYLMRTYFSSDGTAAGLYIGYWETQRRGDAVHSPLNCLPGVGWQPLSRRLLAIESSSDGPIEVNRYVVQKGSERLLILYWYQSQGRVISSEYAGKFFLVADALRTGRSDTAIVRVITPITGSGLAAEASAERGAAEFARRILPILDHYIPL